MWRTLSVCALLLLPSLAVHAADKPNEKVIRMTVQPMAAPKPALKYRLLPELREMNPGNPIQGYLTSYMQRDTYFAGSIILSDPKKNADEEKWQAMPLKNLPLKEMQFYRTNFGLRLADSAARLDNPDWQLLLRLKRDGVNVMLPDVQALRRLAGALQIRFRMELAERHFDEALSTAKTMFAMSRHLSEHPLLIGNLVGLAIGNLSLNTVDEMIQQPGCPNLFWALTDLPTPFVDIRKAFQGERVVAETELAGLNDREPMTEKQLHKVVNRLAYLAKAGVSEESEARKEEATWRQWLESRSGNKEHVRAARKRLSDGRTPADAAKIDSFPPLQIVLLDEKRTMEIQRDEQIKALALPYWQARRVLESIPPIPKDKRTPFLKLLYGSDSFTKYPLRQALLDQHIGLLRCVEALRIYAAEHDGKLPEKLDDIRLPLPVDPATGKPFTYKVDGKTAHLHGAPLGSQVRYEVTIGK